MSRWSMVVFEVSRYGVERRWSRESWERPDKRICAARSVAAAESHKEGVKIRTRECDYTVNAVVVHIMNNEMEWCGRENSEVVEKGELA